MPSLLGIHQSKPDLHSACSSLWARAGADRSLHSFSASLLIRCEFTCGELSKLSMQVHRVLILVFPRLHSISFLFFLTYPYNFRFLLPSFPSVVEYSPASWAADHSYRWYHPTLASPWGSDGGAALHSPRIFGPVCSLPFCCTADHTDCQTHPTFPCLIGA